MQSELHSHSTSPSCFCARKLGIAQATMTAHPLVSLPSLGVHPDTGCALNRPFFTVAPASPGPGSITIQALRNTLCLNMAHKTSHLAKMVPSAIMTGWQEGNHLLAKPPRKNEEIESLAFPA